MNMKWQILAGRPANATYDTIAVVPWGIYPSPIELPVRNAYGQAGRLTQGSTKIHWPVRVWPRRNKGPVSWNYPVDVTVITLPTWSCSSGFKKKTYGNRRSKSNKTRNWDDLKFTANRHMLRNLKSDKHKVITQLLSGSFGLFLTED
jgi:hypothetical protein